MPLLVYGLNHESTSLDMRGRLSVAEDELAQALLELRAETPDLAEAAILSTCNRIEIHAYANEDGIESIKQWLAHSRQVPIEEFSFASYVHKGRAAAAHAMRVAAGLDSQILGEPQIQGQFKLAYRHARESGTLGKELSLLEDFTLQTAKRIRTETKIGAEPVSVAFAAVTMAKQIFAEFATQSVLLIGAGTNIQLIAKYLRELGITSFTIANRTRTNAEILASDLAGRVINLDEIADELHNFDMVVSSTGSAKPIVTEKMLSNASRLRRHRAMFVADLGVPRDVEAKAANLPDVYLHTVDDLSTIISQSLTKRQEFTTIAERLIDDGVECYVRKRRLQLEAKLLSNYRTQVDTIRATALKTAHKNLDAGDDPATVMSQLADHLTKQLAHKPTISIRQATASGNEAFLHLLKEIYELDTV
ncbi:MAG: glutamyl-tRNA reductase [Gammaproteobacteria bacterium]|nr:glutamyl-tRNA reductase [Gammaproteobacteria bacterium]